MIKQNRIQVNLLDLSITQLEPAKYHTFCDSVAVLSLKNSELLGTSWFTFAEYLQIIYRAMPQIYAVENIMQIICSIIFHEIKKLKSKVLT